MVSICLSLSMCLVLLAGEEPEATKEAVARRAERPPTIDGKFDDQVWATATVIDRFPAFWEGTKSTGRTKARFLWDEKGLYFAGEMLDSSVKSFGTKRNDTLWNGDVFELFFKPSTKNKQYYEFQVNPASLTFELQLPGNSSPDRPTLGLKAVAVVHGTLNQEGDEDMGWTVEGMIPWSAFSPTGGAPKPGEVWNFAVCRYDYGKGSTPPKLTSSAPLKRLSFHKTEDYGQLTFEGPKLP